MRLELRGLCPPGPPVTFWAGGWWGRPMGWQRGWLWQIAMYADCQCGTGAGCEPTSGRPGWDRRCDGSNGCAGAGGCTWHGGSYLPWDVGGGDRLSLKRCSGFQRSDVSGDDDFAWIAAGCITDAVGLLALNGSVGATGPSGAAATVSIGTVTTGAAGSQATVTNSGTAGAVLNSRSAGRSWNGGRE